MGESKFDKLANKIAKEYRKDGDSAEKAKEIGEATAAKIGFAKYGKRGMERKARAGRDAESFSAECVCGITCVCDCGCAESGVCDCGPSCPCSCGCGVEIETQDAESFEAPPSSRESKVARAMKTRSSGKSRGKKKGPFVFPARKAYPIGDMSHAKRALVFSTWPDNKRDAKKVRDAVFKRYPKLRNWFKDGKYAKHAESFDADDEPYCQSCGATLEEVREGLCECPGDCQEGEHFWRMGSLYQDGGVIIGTNGVCTECGLEKRELFSDDITWTYNDAESFDAEKIEGQTQSNIYAKFFVGHVSNDELRGNGKFKTYDSAVKKAKEVAKKEGNSRVVSPMGAALWTSNDKGLFQAGHLTKEAKRFYNSEEEMAVGYLSAESTIYDAPMSVHDEYCIMQGQFCVMEKLPGKELCKNCDVEYGAMFPQDAEYTALGVPTRRIRAREIMSPSMRALREIFIVGGLLLVLAASASSSAGKQPKGESHPIVPQESSYQEV